MLGIRFKERATLAKNISFCISKHFRLASILAHHHFSKRTRILTLTFALTPDEPDMWGALEPIYDSKIIYGSLGIKETVKKDDCFLVSVTSKAEQSLKKRLRIIAPNAPVHSFCVIDPNKSAIFSQGRIVFFKDVEKK